MNRENDEIISEGTQKISIHEMIEKQLPEILGVMQNEKKKVSANEESPFSLIGKKNKSINIFSNSHNKKERYKILCYYLIHPITELEKLKDGKRIFNNRTIYSGFEEGYLMNFIEFKQLLYENLLLTHDLDKNPKEKFSLESGIFCTFVYDPEFIIPLIKTHKINILLVKDNNEKANIVEKYDENLTFYHPKIDFTLKWGKFHSKLIILKFSSFLRVIIPSANLTDVDWYFLGQNIWFQDFYPKLKSVELYTAEELEFEEYLKFILKFTIGYDYESQEYFTKLKINLSEYDFSTVCVDLVGTLSGKFVNERLKLGIGRIRELTQKYYVAGNDNSNEKVVYQCSSIGSLKENFIQDFLSSFIPHKDKKQIIKNLEIIFPSQDYIDSIENGIDLASCLFLSKEMYEKEFFPKNCFKTLELKSNQLILKSNFIFHSKFILILGKNNEITNDSTFYFGSHNFSPSAWGNFQKYYSQISSANYELGIIFNPRKLSLQEKKNIFDSILINVNSNNFDKNEKPYMKNWTFS